MKIDWKKALGYGVLLYIIVYVVATAFVAYKINPASNNLAWLVMMAVTIVLGYVLSIRLELRNYVTALMYGLVWGVLTLVLDLLLTVPFTGVSFFMNPQFVVGGLLIVLLPSISHLIQGLITTNK